MTNNELPTNYYNATETASGRLSHKHCTHPADVVGRQNCRYETAKKNFAATAARRAARPKVAHGPIVIRDMNEVA